MDKNIKREIWIDVCRGIGIILVILGHCHTPVDKIIYGFHMPLFFVISGYLFKKKELGAAIKDYFKKYISPYFILCFINLIIMYILSLLGIKKLVGGGTKYLVGIIYSRGTVEWMPNCSPLWFLTCLFVCLIVYQIILMCDNKKCIAIMVWVCTLISYLLSKYCHIKLPWNLDTALMAILFIYIGNNLNFNKITNKNVVYILIFFLIGILFVEMNSEIVSFDNNKYGNLILMITGSIMLIWVVIYISYKCKFKYAIRYLSFMGKHTIFIMGFDYLSGNIANVLIEFFCESNWILLFFVKIILLTLAINIYVFLLHKIPNKKLVNFLSY